MVAFGELMDLLDLAVGRSRGVVPEDVVDEVERSARRMRSRGDFLGDALVVAVAGGTGSGKSSLVNALCEAPVAPVSPLRPFTDRPLAAAPEGSVGQVEPWLREIGIDDVVTYGGGGGLVLIDLPDLDSVARWHRAVVERILPAVDAVLWVFDPVKYRDPGIHRSFLEPLAGYHRQFAFVLNQIDRFSEVEAKAIAEDLTDALEHDGFPAPEVIRVAADPDHGDPMGIWDLRSHLDERLDAKRTTLQKIGHDVIGAARTLAAPAGLWSGANGAGTDEAFLAATVASLGVAGHEFVWQLDPSYGRRA